LNEYEPIIIDPVKLTNQYLNQNDWRRRESSSVTFSVGALSNYMSAAITSAFWLDSVYTPDISAAHRSCDMHIHDLGAGGPQSYCAGWSPRMLIEEGLNGVPHKINSKPASHLDTAMQQIINFLGIMANEWAGAQAFSSFDTYLAPFIRKDKLTYEQVKQPIQQFLFGVNVPSRWSSQPPFSNVTLDLLVPDDLKESKPRIGGKLMNFAYGDLQEEMNMFNRAFFEVFMSGDANGNTFQYPILTLNCTRELFEKLDPTVEKQIWEVTAKHGTPYFSNYINSDMKPSEVRSMCCRLRLSLTELTKKNGSLFGSGDSTGSIGVVTLNLPKCGYLSYTEDELLQRIGSIAGVAKDSLVLKRKKLNEFLEMGLYPYTKRFLSAGFANHFSTIGVVGANEMCRNFFRNSKKKDLGIASKEGKALSIKVLEFLRHKISEYQEENPDTLFNLESTPAESTAYRFAMHDKKKYPNILTAGTVEAPYYTNSTNLPVNYTTDPWEAIEFQNEIQPLYTGGTVHHVFADNNSIEPEKVKDFIKKIMFETKLPYVTFSPTLKVCKHGHGMLVADGTDVCPECKRVALESYENKLNELKEKRAALIESLARRAELKNEGTEE